MRGAYRGESHGGDKARDNVLHPLDRIGCASCLREEGVEEPEEGRKGSARKEEEAGRSERQASECVRKAQLCVRESRRGGVDRSGAAKCVQIHARSSRKPG